MPSPQNMGCICETAARVVAVESPLLKPDTLEHEFLIQIITIMSCRRTSTANAELYDPLTYYRAHECPDTAG